MEVACCSMFSHIAATSFVISVVMLALAVYKSIMIRRRIAKKEKDAFFQSLHLKQSHGKGHLPGETQDCKVEKKEIKVNSEEDLDHHMCDFIHFASKKMMAVVKSESQKWMVGKNKTQVNSKEDLDPQLSDFIHLASKKLIPFDKSIG